MRVALLLLFALTACGPGVELTPRSGSSYGQYTLRARGAELAKLSDPVKVSVGGTAAYGVQREAPDALVFTVQGAEQPGAAEVIASDKTQSLKLGSFSYDKPRDAALTRVVAFGASLTMGVQSSSIASHGQLHGPAVQFAQAAGAYLSVPLVKDDYMPGLTADDFDLATCQPKFANLDQLMEQRGLSNVLPKITDDQNGIVIAKIRVDPEIEVRNVAIGGFKVHDIVHGPTADFPLTLMEHLVWNAHATQNEIFDPPSQTMLDRVEALHPTLLMATDFFANDYVTLSLSGSGPPDLSQLTPIESFATDVDALLTRLDGTGAEVFVGNGPDPSFMQPYQQKVKSLVAAGYSQADATAWLTALRDRIHAYNDELSRQAAQHPHVHVVDVAGMVDDIVANGVAVDGQTLQPVPFGGLLSFDGEHFSDTGYALLANAYVRAVNGWLGHEAIPLIDLAAVKAQDPFSIENLRAAGFACAGLQHN